MTIPAMIIGTITAAFLGALYHVIRGGSLGRLVAYLLAAIAFFWAGHIFAQIFNLTFASLGPVHLGLAIPVCIAGLILIEYLGAVEDTGGEY